VDLALIREGEISNAVKATITASNAVMVAFTALAGGSPHCGKGECIGDLWAVNADDVSQATDSHSGWCPWWQDEFFERSSDCSAATAG
jgi:hypothetical protein